MINTTFNRNQSGLVEHFNTHDEISVSTYTKTVQFLATSPGVQYMDKYSILEYYGDLSKSHRWTAEDIGRKYLMVKKPDYNSTGLLAICEITHVENKHMVEFDIVYAERLSCPTKDSSITCTHIKTDHIDRIELNGKRPFMGTHIDQMIALMGDDDFLYAADILMWLQCWAFQPQRQH